MSKWLAALLAYSLVSISQAAVWPEKPVSLIVPFPAGGGTDNVARPLAAQLQKQLGQAFVVDNRGGAGGNIGTAHAARSAADGYTFLVGGTSMSIAPSVYKDLNYDPINDFQTVSVIAIVPQVIVVNPRKVASDSLSDFIGNATRDNKQLTFGSSGTGTVHQLAGELFKAQTGLDMLHVPYRGAGPAMQDLIGGQIDVMFDGLSTSAAHIKAGSIKALAIASSKRSASLPGVPTTVEGGLPDYKVASWFGVWAPKNTPDHIVAKMAAEIEKALKSEQVQQAWAALGAEIGPTNPTEATEFLIKESEKWAGVVEAANITLD